MSRSTVLKVVLQSVCAVLVVVVLVHEATAVVVCAKYVCLGFHPKLKGLVAACIVHQ